MLTTRSGRQAMGWGWILSTLLTALLAIVVRSVSARVCTLMIDLDVVGCGRRMGRFVLPPGDPCTCTGVRLGGHYHRLAPEMQGQDPPLFMDMLPEVTAEVIGRWFNCSTAEPTEPPADCQDILDAGQTTSGVYTIQHKGQNMQVYCRMELGNGYIVFQRRLDGSVSFNRTWQEYAEGFGDLTGEFWLGSEKLHSLTGDGGWELVITLRAFDGDEARVRYGDFRIDSYAYWLDIAGFIDESGEADDSLIAHRHVFFSTRDNDDWETAINCAKTFHGGWWYRYCGSDSTSFKSNLNGLYYDTAAVAEPMQGIHWSTWKGRQVSLKGCEMMTRCKP